MIDGSTIASVRFLKNIQDTEPRHGSSHSICLNQPCAMWSPVEKKTKRCVQQVQNTVPNGLNLWRHFGGMEKIFNRTLLYKLTPGILQPCSHWRNQCSTIPRWIQLNILNWIKSLTYLSGKVQTYIKRMIFLWNICFNVHLGNIHGERPHRECLATVTCRRIKVALLGGTLAKSSRIP